MPDYESHDFDVIVIGASGAGLRAAIEAKERGLVDELGGLRTAMTRAKVLAGLQPDDDVKVISLPGSSLLELLRPKPSSQPAAASLSDAVGGLVVQSAVGLLGRVEQSVSGVNALWLGNYQF